VLVAPRVGALHLGSSSRGLQPPQPTSRQVTIYGWSIELIESAQERWRSVNAPHLVALVRAGARFERGVLVEREQATSA
jgi:hypothetical protein